MMDLNRIRNFAIIAHIDHGKSTLADRLIENTGALSKREMRAQILDNLSVERKHGITIKAQGVRIIYKYNGVEYYLNLIDTPGHVDFNYEVSKSLSACEGCLLVVDAAQGVEAQTVVNAYLALEHNLEIIPVINKIDLPNADIEKVKKEIEDGLGIDAHDALLVSAKNNIGIDELLISIVNRIPSPKGNINDPLKALIIDSWYDNYKGVIFLSRIFDGFLNKGDKIMIYSNRKTYVVEEIGVFTPKQMNIEYISTGDVGYVVANIRTIQDIRVGDTITVSSNPTSKPLRGFNIPKPFVYAGYYPTDPDDFKDLKVALEKLQLNDPSLIVENDNSDSLGFGFRCGFLGVLSMYITKERLEDEFGLDIVVTAPSVLYKVQKKNGERIEISNPSLLPPQQEIDAILEPYVSIEIVTPSNFIGNILKLLEEERGEQKSINYISFNRVIIKYSLPLSSMVVNFYDRLKSISKGRASFDYTVEGFKEANLSKLIILINNQEVDSLSMIVPKEKAYRMSKSILLNLRSYVPKQLFEVRLQAKVDGRIIARERIAPLKKDVLAKCYGGDITRKRKLLEKQKKGKKKLKELGNVNISKDAFIKLMELKKG